MSFISIAIIGYLLLSVESVLSKALLVKRLANWQIYVFYVGIFSIFSFVLFPLGLVWSGWNSFGLAFLSGLIFLGAISFLFKALRDSTASRVYTLFGSFTAITTFLFSEMIFLKDLNIRNSCGIILLLVGGFFIAYKFYKKRFFRNWKKIVIAGFLSGVSLIILKLSFENQNFISGYIYSRMGIVAGTIGLLTFPFFRKNILKQFKKRKTKEKLLDFTATVGIKILAGLGTIIVTYAIFLGNITVVNSLASIQYLFTFIFSIILSIHFKLIFQEELTKADLLSKLIGVVLVIVGIILVSI